MDDSFPPGRVLSRAPAALLLAAIFSLLAACGGDEEPPPAAGPEDWSAPTPVEAEGMPDVDDGVRAAEALLADLRTRVAEGRGHADASFQRAVEDVATVLWEGAVLASANHMQVCAIAGEVSRWLAASPDARAEHEKSHPTDVAVHDAFLKAAAGGPEAYVAWCEQDAFTLLTAHREAAFAKHFPDRVKPAPVDDPPPPRDPEPLPRRDR